MTDDGYIYSQIFQTMKTLKESAVHFLNLTVSGQSREAFRLYAAENFKHHNAYFKGDGETLMLAMEENAKQHPNKLFEVQRALEDEDMVAVHSKVVMDMFPLGLAVMHIFHFKNGRIEELWDFGQAVPENMLNENGMF
jgi:predicted SnoaL-like aldol condensation-catalyzing enzyme